MANESDNTLEKIKLRNELLRFFFGTFLIAVLTLGFNALLKHWEYNDQSEKLRYDTYEKYLDRFDNTEDRIDKIVLARTLSFIAPDEEIRNGYKELYVFLEKNYGQENQLEKAKIAKEVEQQLMTENLKGEKPEVLAQFNSVSTELEKENTSKEEKIRAKQEYEDLLKSNPELNDLVNLDNQIKEKEDLIDNVRKESTIPLKKSEEEKLNRSKYTNESGWFKEGYMITFEDTRIHCDKLDTKSQNATIRIQNKSGNTYSDAITFQIKEGEKKELLNSKYLFSFNRIGKAGKNPFTKAVYFDLKIKNN